MSIGPVEKKIHDALRRSGTLCAGLIDAEDLPPEEAADRAKRAESCGLSLLLVGGSTVADQFELDSIVKAVKSAVEVPVVLFPGNITGIGPSADAIFFSSLLNSDNPYFIIGAQALASLTVKKHKIEALPMGYIAIGDGGTMGFVGRSRGIPETKPQLAAMYALAAQYLGMRFVYLEAGSGVTSHISPKLVRAVRKMYDGVLIVGGGIRDSVVAGQVASAGANIIVIGTLLETDDFEPTLSSIVKATKSARTVK